MKQPYVIFLAIISVFITAAWAHAPDDMLANMTYVVGDECHSQKVTLVEGKYRYPDKHPLLCVYYEGEFVYGDFNNDGLQDAAVVIYDSGGGSGYSTNLAFLINDGSQLVHKSSYDLGYRPDIILLSAERGNVIIDMMVYNESTWAEGIKDQVKATYEYTEPTAWGPSLGYPTFAFTYENKK